MSDLIIGLTSGIAGGKGVAARFFSHHGIDHVDADKISHRLTGPGTPLAAKIISRFGEGYRKSDGSLDRKTLRNRIFTMSADRLWLENLLHPPIHTKLIRSLQKCRSPYALLVSPLILETSQHQLCDKIIVIDVKEKIQLERASTRDNMSVVQVQRILAAQIPIKEKVQQADYILENNGTKEELAEKVSDLHHNLLLLSRKKNKHQS